LQRGGPSDTCESSDGRPALFGLVNGFDKITSSSRTAPNAQMFS
jgi:hypothetical protein